MRKSNLLSALMPETRQQILAATLPFPTQTWYLSDLAKHLGVSPSTLQRELAALTQTGILRRTNNGNRVYYQANTQCPVFLELRALITKTVGLVDQVRDALYPLRKQVDCAFVHGSIARSEEISESDIDLMVIGGIGLADLAHRLRPIEKRLGRAINPSVYPRNEFAAKLAAGNHFLSSVLEQPRLFVLGDEDVLKGITEEGAHPAPQDKQTRDRRPAGRRRA